MAFADPESVVNGTKTEDEGTGNYQLNFFQSSMNLLAHVLIGIVVGISLLFSFRHGLPIEPVMSHIVLCVIGYQLLMAEAILVLCPNNSWAAGLRLVDKRRVHTVLQIAGSVLAIVGSLLMSADKTVNWNTLHGKFGLVALVFTTVSLVNGLTSLYAHELRNCVPGNFSKIPHIIFGVVAFVASCISLCYGFDKGFFRNWATPAFTYTVIAMSAAFTFIIIVNPMITAFNKTVRMCE